MAERFPISRIITRMLLIITLNTFVPLALKTVALSGAKGVGMLFNPYLALAVVAMGCSFLLWRSLLLEVRVSLLHPFCALVQVTVPLGAWFLFDEKVSPLFFAGLVFVIAGIILTSGGAEK